MISLSSLLMKFVSVFVSVVCLSFEFWCVFVSVFFSRFGFEVSYFCSSIDVSLVSCTAVVVTRTNTSRSASTRNPNEMCCGCVVCVCVCGCVCVCVCVDVFCRCLSGFRQHSLLLIHTHEYYTLALIWQPCPAYVCACARVRTFGCLLSFGFCSPFVLLF